MNLINLAGWSWLWEIINGLMLIICNLIYWIITLLYQVFVAVAKVNLFSREIFKELTSRMYVVIAIAMLFVFAYNIILMIVNPDDKKTIGQGGKLVKEAVTSFVLIILLPTIFNWLYVFQNNILDSGIIPTVILGSVGSSNHSNGTNCAPDDYDCHCDFTGYGLNEYTTDDGWLWDSSTSVEADIRQKCLDYQNLSPSQRGAYMIPPLLMSTFYRPKHYTFDQCVDHLQNGTALVVPSEQDINDKVCVNYFYDVTTSKYTGDINTFVGDKYLRQIVSDSDYDVVEFNWLWAIVAGIIAAYMFLCYAMEIGVRVAKLGFLQIISPIPVMMRIIPKQKEKIYDKWFKQLVETYTDVFIRLAIIYFTLFAVSLVPDVIDAMTAGFQASHAQTGGGIGGFVIISFAKVFVILGVLKFAQDCPKLIKEFIGDSGRFSLKSPRKQLSENKALGGLVGGVGSGVVGMTRNFSKTEGGFFSKSKSALGGMAGGLIKGSKAGYKNGVGKSYETISATAETLETNREKHKALREQGYMNAAGAYLGKKWSNTVDFLKGDVASTEIGKAANQIMIDVDNMESTFSNANIANIKAGRDEIMKKFNSDQDFDFDGKHYHKVSATHWDDGQGGTVENGKLSKQIATSYKNRLAVAYAENEFKSKAMEEGFKRATEGLLKDLRESMPKMGSAFSEEMFKKLNGLKDVNGNEMKLDVNSLDDLEDRMKKLMSDPKTQSSIYLITDEIKSHHKDFKLNNEQALKAAESKKGDKK